MEAEINVHRSHFIEKLDRVELISLLKGKIEQRLYLEKYVDLLEEKLKKEQDE